MKFCKSKHEVAEDAKFCGECGSAAEDVAKAMAIGADELDAALGALDDVHKAVTGLEDDLDFEDDDPSAGEEDGLGRVAKSLAPGDDGSIDAMPVLDALFTANNRQARTILEVGREARALRKELGTVAKSVATAVRSIHGLFAQGAAAAASIADQPRARRAQVELVQKSIPGLSAGDSSPRGESLWKAAVDAEVAGKLRSGDATMVQILSNQGHTLDSIIKSVPDLGARLAGVFTQAA